MQLQLSNSRGTKIAEGMIGLFFEDINFAADGGLYAEMIENRSFEAQEAFGTPGFFYTKDDYGYAWSAIDDGPELEFVTGDPLSNSNPHYLRFTSFQNNQGFKNKAYDGMTLKKGMKYHVSFYARAVKYDNCGVSVSITKDEKIYAEGKVKLIHATPYMPFSDLKVEWPDEEGEWGEMIKHAKLADDGTGLRQNEWKKYSVDITSSGDTRNADFNIRLDGVGTVDFDLISVIPDDAVAGVFRKDLFDALKELHPGFIRFPGGCIVEGISLLNRYQWKKTVGPVEDRYCIPNLWAFEDDRTKEKLGIKVQRPDSHYGQSYGIGFFEYFLLCELLGARPLPVLNVGVACQFRSTQLVPVDSPEFEEYINDALDLIEFANGDVSTKWGALRAQMGHADPFDMTLIGIGNEQWETKYVDFQLRASRFEQAIHEKYPEINIIGSAGPNVETSLTDEAWEYYREKEKANKNNCYAVDEHYYVSPEWMYEHVDMYDEYPRDVAVFAGEYAAHPDGRRNNMEGALAEAALLTGIERNADVVKLASYAPLFNRIGHSQWTPDMIWFDDRDVYLTPSYYVQKMYATNQGEYVMPLDGQEKALRDEKIYVSATVTSDGEYILKMVNASDSNHMLSIVDDCGNRFVQKAVKQTLKAMEDIADEKPQPSKIEEQEVDLSGEINLETGTFSIIRF